jgi:linoleate 10R-lipoxygenase
MYSDNNLKKWSSSFSTLTQRLLKEKEIKQAGSAVRYVDVVKDVINLVPVHWIANEVVSICLLLSILTPIIVSPAQAGLPIKTHDNPRGMYREQELYQNFADISK